MKMFIMGLLALTSLSVFAGRYCERALHGSLLRNAGHMEQAYTAFYFEISDELDRLCPKNLNDDSMRQVCSALCEESAEEFHKSINTRFFFSSKVKTLKAECNALCAATDF